MLNDEETSRESGEVDPARLPTGLSQVTGGTETARTLGKSSLACRRGHEWTPETTLWRSDGRRQCRTCKRERMKEWMAANRDHYQAAKRRAARAPQVEQFNCGHDRMGPNILRERRPDGRVRERCRECYYARKRRSRERNRESRLEGLRQARQDNPERFAEYKRRTLAKLRAETQAAYGGVCAGCGVGGSLGQELDLDHIQGGGNAERERLNHRGWWFYSLLRTQGFPGKGTDYQLLCKPCHKVKDAREAKERAARRHAGTQIVSD